MDLSVVIPVYNGVSFIERSIVRLCEYLSSLPGVTWEVIVVNDGSSDGTSQVLDCLDFPGVVVSSLMTNSGKFAALKRGMELSRGRCCIFTDADLPYDLEAISYTERLVNERGFHVIIGDRTIQGSEYKAKLSPVRALATELFSLFVRAIVTGGLFDTQCGFKGFRGDVARALFPLIRDNRFSGDVEALYIALKYNLELKRIPVRLRQQSPSTVRLSSDSLKMLARICLLRSNWKRGKYSSTELERIGRQVYWEEPGSTA